MRRGLELGGLRICFLMGLVEAGGFFFVSYFRFFRRALLVNRFLLLLNFLVLCFFLFLLTRFGGGLSFRVFCTAGFMLLSLIICCFSNFLLIPFFIGLMADSASLVSISFLSSSVFILFVVWLMLSLFFHCLALFLFFFFFCSLTVYCTLYSLPRSLLGPTPGYPLGPRGPTCSEDYGQDRIC